ncbi:phosphorylase family protein [Aquisphaera insulae]|uniref:phosphorylase family protein n=1 Tax=Aquisphaera insulae TaxID=2712864 RepID=UPI0013EADCD2|nr:nucleoside phosphorylase [Aquisphaera insulae]
MKTPGTQRIAPAPAPADVGIVMAMPIEAGYLLDALSKVRKYSAGRHAVVEGELAGKVVAVVVTGPGEAAATRGTEHLVAGHRPRRLISAGFGGALDPALARNDLVLPREVAGSAGGLHEANPDVPEIPGIRRVGGRLLTVDRVITSTAEKADLGRAHGADVVDMETAAVARLAHVRSIPFYSIRVISDDASTELPPEVARMLTKSGSYRVGVALRAIWNRPAAIKDFMGLHARALECADRLASGITRLLESLP